MACVATMFLGTQLYGQDGVERELITDFQSGTFPDNFTVIDRDGNQPGAGLQTSNWVLTTFTGGTDVFAISNSWFSPPGQADDWMIIQDVVVDSAGLKTFFTFDGYSYNPNYLERLQILVDPDNSAEPDSFELVQTFDPLTSEFYAEHVADITKYQGDTISIAVRYNSNDKYYVIIDNLGLMTLNNVLGAEISNAANDLYIVEGDPVFYKFNLKNLGAETIESLTVSLKSGEDSTELELSDVGLGTYEKIAKGLEIPAELIKTPGMEISVDVTHINGQAVDFDATTIAYSVVAEEDVAEKLALSEMFTSSSCPPCKPGNAKFQTIINNNIDQDVHYIKFQEDFPGNGDPYCTDETVNRRLYYGVNAVPNLRVDGSVYVINPNSMNAASYKMALNSPGFVDFENVEYEVDSHTVTVTGTYTVLSKVLPNTRLMAAIVEDTTYKNATTNGETVFYHVVKKLIGGNEGIDITSVPVLEPQEFELSYTFNGEYRLPPNGLEANRIDNATEHSVEEFSDLNVSLWVENKDVQFILNSVNAELLDPTSTNFADLLINEMTVYPQPAYSNAQVEINLEKNIQAEISIVNMSGQKVQSVFNGTLHTGNNTFSADVTDLPAGRYILELRGENLYKGVPVIVVH